jgi:hypothetical protein
VWDGVKAPEGVEQVRIVCVIRITSSDWFLKTFMKFECTNARDEADKRFEYFTKKVRPFDISVK